MGIKKYEIITVGSDKRVRALRSWAVGNRYVNIGDVGGIVYDEKTLSQEGACWLFKGNFNFPGARISGDAIVDVGGIAPAESPTLTIDGESTVVSIGSVRFAAGVRTANLVLTADDFEQGGYGTDAVGQVPSKVQSSSGVRTIKPIFLGGNALSVNLPVEGFSARAIVMDRDNVVLAQVNTVNGGAGVTMNLPAGHYAYLVVTKNPVAVITPADATAAQVSFKSAYDAPLHIRDSRLSVTGSSAAIVLNTGSSDIEDGFTIDNSEVTINTTGSSGRDLFLMSNMTGCDALVRSSSSTDIMGNYDNCNLTFNGVLMSSKNAMSANSVNGKDSVLEVTAANIPGLADIVMSDNPLTFTRCNMDHALIYDHPAIKNTYTDVDFSVNNNSLGERLGDNAVFSPSSYGVSEADVIMRDNATVTSGLSVNGVLRMKDNAKVVVGTAGITGDITLCGSYNQTAGRSWTGKRVIYSETEPTYDNNVKTRYDF